MIKPELHLFMSLTVKGLRKQLDFSETKLDDHNVDEDKALEFLSDIEDAIEEVYHEYTK